MRLRFRGNPMWDSAHLPNYTSASGGYSEGTYTIPHSEVQYMLDDVHPVSQLGKTLNDIGGPMESIKISLDVEDWTPRELDPNYHHQRAFCLPMPPLNNLSGSSEDQWPGESAWSLLRGQGFLPESQRYDAEFNKARFFPDGSDPYGLMADNAMDSFGTTAINRVRPTVPAVDLATAVAEFISEWGFFSIPGSSGSVSGEYLNYSLGITPAVSTVTDLREAMNNQESIIQQYERDSGRLVRRRYVPRWEWTDRSTTIRAVNKLPTDFGGAIASVYRISDYGTHDIRFRTTHKTWFSGAFTYSLPESGWRRTLHELDSAYGIIPGVDTVWELVPFSFVADYFANLGDVLANAASFAEDGLVMPYGYVMSHKTYEYDCTWTGPLAGYGPKARLAAILKIEVKQRRAATPFGFGFDMGSITPRQGSILAALGMSVLRGL